MTQRNTIRTFALICVGVTSLFIMGVIIWFGVVIQSDWCSAAIGAQKDAGVRSIEAVQACFNLLNVQLGTLGTALFVGMGTIALCLLVLMVIVVAGGRLSFTASKDGASANIGSDPGVAAQDVADAAQDQANEIKGDAP